MIPLFDPRRGDVEDDALSTKQRSLLSLAGSLLAEISPVKLIVAWVMLIGLPGLVLGSLPLLMSLWLGKISTQLKLLLTGVGSLLVLCVLLLVTWLGWRRLWRMLEASFWSLHALGLQPSYVVGREVIRHLAEKTLSRGGDPRWRAVIRSTAGLISAAVLSLLAAWIAVLAWPHTRWTASLADLADPAGLLLPAAANAIMIVATYFSVATVFWGIADAAMDTPRDMAVFASHQPGVRQWRIAHLSDIHTVASPYGFRIESGRSGPRGNQRLQQLLARLAQIHAQNPIDHILITGDLTDAGAATEWAACLDALAGQPQLRHLIAALPGNHDLNVVDRANPARLDLPGSPLQLIRHLRMLSALYALQGGSFHVIDVETGRPGPSLEAYMEPHRAMIASYADHPARRSWRDVSAVVENAFPMVRPPANGDELGVIVLNSNASSHFSFTNALGMLSIAQTRAVEAVMEQYPNAFWIVALHHHLVEYPTPAKALSERIGTALINGSHVVRRLRRHSSRMVFMHGHRHTQWIGKVGGITIISAPSPVMEATDADTTHFFVHTLEVGADGALDVLQPEKVILLGSAGASSGS